jgi:tetratricopeptide (TPR) repeat protein
VRAFLTAVFALSSALSVAIAATNLSVQGKAIGTKPVPEDTVEKEYQQLLEDDDAAQADVDKWITENQALAAKGVGKSDADMTRRILDRFDPIKKHYEDFIRRHPEHAKIRVAYGSFLNDIHDEQGAQEQWEKGRELDPKNPAVWNNLANHYGHDGEVKKAFEYYAKAIELNAEEPIYYHNFGTTVYLFRKDAKEFYNITEQQVFDKAMDLYAKAIKLDPTNFPLSSDIAQTYYGIKPLRVADALRAWTNTLAIAHDEVEREGVYLHLARIKLAAERFDEARMHVNAVTNTMYNDLKQRLTRNLNEQELKARGTNGVGEVLAPTTTNSLKTPAPDKNAAPP